MATLILVLCQAGYGVREAVAVATAAEGQAWAAAYALATADE